MDTSNKLGPNYTELRSKQDHITYQNINTNNIKPNNLFKPDPYNRFKFCVGVKWLP